MACSKWLVGRLKSDRLRKDMSLQYMGHMIYWVGRYQPVNVEQATQLGTYRKH